MAEEDASGAMLNASLAGDLVAAVNGAGDALDLSADGTSLASAPTASTEVSFVVLTGNTATVLSDADADGADPADAATPPADVLSAVLDDSSALVSEMNGAGAARGYIYSRKQLLRNSFP